MRNKKVYMPLGVCLVILAIGFLALSPDVVDDPVKRYKATPSADKSETPASTQETATSDTSQGGHFHADGTFHAETHAEVEKKDGHFHADRTWDSTKDSEIPPESLIMILSSSDKMNPEMKLAITPFR